MSGYKRVNFYELCRLCATNQQKEKTHIFQEEGRKIQLQNKILSCLSLKVCEDDFLPKVVCSQCLNTLEECYTFKKECQGSETMLSSYFNNFRYTEDFKKSGKVYIKDTTTKVTPIVSQTSLQNISTNYPTSTTQTETVFVTENPTTDMSYVNIQNSGVKPNNNNNNNNNNLKTENLPSKIVQNNCNQSQVTYNNLNSVSIDVLKNILQNSTKTDTVANVTVNANGEIIGIGPIMNFDSLLSQSNSNNQKSQPLNKPSSQSRKKQKKRVESNSYLEDQIVKIDLTDSNQRNESLNVEQKCNKQNYANLKGPLISDVSSAQLVQKFINSSHLSHNQVSKLSENEQNSQIFAGNSNINYNSSSINVMTNVNLQNVNLNTVNNSVNNSVNFNNYSQQNNLVQNVSNMSMNLPQKIQNNSHRKVFNTNVTNLDLNSHMDANLEKNNFSSMNILNVNANLLNNLNLNSLNNGSNSSITNLKSEEKIHSSVSNQNVSLTHSKVNTVLHMTPQSETLDDNICSTSVAPINSQTSLVAPSTSNATALLNEGKSHVCEICKKSFKRKEHLYQHVKLHTGFRPFRCENCNKCFMRKEHLLRHMTAHSGAKNFSCDICEKSFSRNDNLLKHKKTHEKQSKFTCQVCQKHFVMKHYYLAHKLTHETDRCNNLNLWGALKA